MPSPEIEIRLKRLPHGEGLPLPSYGSEHAAGLDVVAAESLTLAPGERRAVATGFALAIPHGWEVQVRPRSGLALKHGIGVLNIGTHWDVPLPFVGLVPPLICAADTSSLPGM